MICQFRQTDRQRASAVTHCLSAGNEIQRAGKLCHLGKFQSAGNFRQLAKLIYTAFKFIQLSNLDSGKIQHDVKFRRRNDFEISVKGVCRSHVALLYNSTSV